jgi:hypothetical protein
MLSDFRRWAVNYIGLAFDCICNQPGRIGWPVLLNIDSFVAAEPGQSRAGNSRNGAH